MMEALTVITVGGAGCFSMNEVSFHSMWGVAIDLACAAQEHGLAIFLLFLFTDLTNSCSFHQVM